MFRPIKPWTDVKAFDEEPGHVGGIGVAAGMGDFGDIQGTVKEKILDPFEPSGVQEIGKAITGMGMKETGKVIGRAFRLAGERLDAQGGVIESVMNILFTEGDFGMLERGILFDGFNRFEKRREDEQRGPAHLDRPVGFWPGAADGGFHEEFGQSMNIVKVTGNEMGGIDVTGLVKNTLMPGHPVVMDHADKIMKRGFVVMEMFVMRGIGGDNASLAGTQPEPGPGQDKIGVPADLDENLRQGVEMPGRRRGIGGHGGDHEGFARMPGEPADQDPQLATDQRQGIVTGHIVE